VSRGPSEPTPDFDVIWLREGTAHADKTPPLSREQIVRTAIELADEGGLDAASVRRIAARLGAGATSLYWHVRSKNDLYELMFDAAFSESELSLPEPTGDWRADIRVFAVRTHEVLRRHPWLILLGIQPGIGPNIRRYAELSLRALSPLGLDRPARTEALAIINNYLLGFAHRQTAWDQLRERAGLTDEQWEQRLDRYLAQARETDPALAADIETRLHLTSDHSFELGLDCVLDGIAARFALVT
jgi:AcrR family transcriptional regulator